jgi:hypothetical protein
MNYQHAKEQMGNSQQRVNAIVRGQRRSTATSVPPDSIGAPLGLGRELGDAKAGQREWHSTEPFRKMVGVWD